MLQALSAGLLMIPWKVLLTLRSVGCIMAGRLLIMNSKSRRRKRSYHILRYCLTEYLWWTSAPPEVWASTYFQSPIFATNNLRDSIQQHCIGIRSKNWGKLGIRRSTWHIICIINQRCHAKNMPGLSLWVCGNCCNTGKPCTPATTIHYSWFNRHFSLASFYTQK